MSLSRSSKGTILIVDDQPANIEVLTLMLAKQGYRVQAADSGESALRAVHASFPDLILLDIRMPDMDGYQVCQQLKADEGTRDIPVIFVSALDEVEDKVKAFAAGGVDYVTKPFRVREVRARVETHLALRRMHRELEEKNAQLEREIAERQRAERALGKSEERYRDLVESIDEVIYAVDEHGVATYVSPAIEILLGYHPAEVIAYPIDHLIHPEDLAQLQESIQRALSGQHTVNEYRVLTKAGMERWVRASSRPFSDGKVVEVRGVMTDITERKQAEEAMRDAAATAERHRLARELHDAVTQTLFSASLMAEALPRVWERHPEQARHGLEELGRLTRGALAEMRTLLLELRPAALTEKPLGDLLPHLTQALSSRLRVPINLSVEGDSSLPADLQVALYRITQEALNNVAKHAQASQVTVELSCRPERTVLRIHDDGRGFDADAVLSGSMGIGIMRERAQQAGVALEVKSAPGEGTEVVALWPS